jgi:nucleoside-diphosphate-sugar epimerase
MIGKRILLVGGCGFIGHNLALLLKKKSHEVSVVDSLSVNNILSFTDSEITNKKLYSSILNNRIDLINDEKINLIVQDARDHNSVSKIYERINPDIIVHLAAVSHANKSNKDPHNTFDHSLRTLENTMDFAKTKKTHVIYMSSSMVYGNFETSEVDEDSKCTPIGIYGSLKLAGEMIVKSYNQVFDIPYTIIRPSALYGERCVSRRVGQVFIENAIQGLDITINGNGKEKLDFTYIEDLVSGIVACCENEKAKNQTFNFTFGDAREVNELVDVLKLEFPKIKVHYKEKENFMPKRGTLKNDKAKSILEFAPQYPIESGYQKYIQWYKSFWNKTK